MTLPIWHAATAYLVSARVTPVTAGGTVWMTEVAGTSGGAEPSWPTSAPWTVTDGGVTWGRASGFRMNTVSGIVSVLTAFQLANPSLLKGIKPARPKSMTNFDLPGAYLGARDESVTHAHDIRTRNITGVIGIVDRVPDNFEAAARMDILVDGLMDALTLAFHAAGAPSIFAQTSVAEVSYDEGTTTYLENLVAYSATLTEGRT